LCINGGFIGFYGSRAFRKALFPLLFLIFMVPIPSAVLDGLIKIFLIGSAETSYAIFTVLQPLRSVYQENGQSESCRMFMGGIF